jgi:hypothetical protein
MAKRERVNCLSKSWEKRLKKRLKARERQASKKEVRNGSTI